VDLQLSLAHEITNTAFTIKMQLDGKYTPADGFHNVTVSVTEFNASAFNKQIASRLLSELCDAQVKDSLQGSIIAHFSKAITTVFRAEIIKSITAVEAEPEPVEEEVEEEAEEALRVRTPDFSDSEDDDEPQSPDSSDDEEPAPPAAPAPVRKRRFVDINTLENLLDAADRLDADLVVEHHRFIRKCKRPAQ